MSVNLLLAGNIQYSKPLVALAVDICTPFNQAPKVVSVPIAWADYGVSLANSRLGVSINLIGQNSQVALLSEIRSVKIDNVGCPVPIYVQFPDTLDTIFCPPNAVVIAPIYSRVKSAVVIGDGFFNNRSPTTTVEFANFDRQGLYVPGDNFAAIDLRYIGRLEGTAITLNRTLGPIATVQPPAPDRLMALAFAARGNAAGAITLNSATINGFAASIAVQHSVIPNPPNTTTLMAAIIYALVPTGATMTYNMIFNANIDFIQAYAYSITNYTQLAPIDTGSDQGTYVDFFRSIQFDGVPGSAALMIGGELRQNAPASIDWLHADLIDTNVQGVLPGNILITTSATREFEIDNGVGIQKLGNTLTGAMWV